MMSPGLSLDVLNERHACRILSENARSFSSRTQLCICLPALKWDARRLWPNCRWVASAQDLTVIDRLAYTIAFLPASGIARRLALRARLPLLLRGARDLKSKVSAPTAIECVTTSGGCGYVASLEESAVEGT